MVTLYVLNATKGEGAQNPKCLWRLYVSGLLKETCLHSKIMYLFDNDTTVIFAIFMSFWTALFLEFWKRYSAEVAHRWQVKNKCLDIQIDR